MLTNNPCSNCGSPWHTAFRCPLIARKTLTATKPMNRIGKVQKKTQAAVAAWKRKQKPNHQGYFTCYMCGKWIPYLIAEHVKSKARSPDLRTDHQNFKPTCDDCNEKKGSKSN